MATKSIAELTAAATLTGTEAVPIVQGSTTVQTTSQAIAGLTTKTTLGLSNVNNTSDANKPISTATQTALNAKANTTSNTFTQTQTLAAGTATLAPLKFQSGVTLTTPAAHSVEWDGTSMSLTNSAATRRRVALDGNWIYDTTTGLTGTYQFDAATYSGAVFNAAMTGATVLNVRGDSSKTLASLLEIGQSIDITVITKSGITSYVLSITIDGVAPTIITPTAPTHTGFSYYRRDWTIIKTAASAFTVIALPQSYA